MYICFFGIKTKWKQELLLEACQLLENTKFSVWMPEDKINEHNFYNTSIILAYVTTSDLASLQ